MNDIIEIALQGKNISVVLVDGNIFTGTLGHTASYGVYMHIGGDPERLNLFPWSQVNRITFNRENA
jgi:hypothetical protein